MDDAAFDALLDEAGAIAQRPVQRLDRIGPGADFPPSDRPAARFVLLECPGGRSG